MVAAHVLRSWAAGVVPSLPMCSSWTTEAKASLVTMVADGCNWEDDSSGRLLDGLVSALGH